MRVKIVLDIRLINGTCELCVLRRNTRFIPSLDERDLAHNYLMFIGHTCRKILHIDAEVTQETQQETFT